MKTKSPGAVHRGSVIHKILAELERYPDSWYLWYQFPDIEAARETVRRSMWRLVDQEKVKSRLVLADTIRKGHMRESLEISWLNQEQEE